MDRLLNEIRFEASREEAQAVFEAVSINREVDFNTLIPTPLHVYRASSDPEVDGEDFGPSRWEWNRANWGTRTNAFQSSFEWNDGEAVIRFVTADRPPHPFIVAFGNRFKREFILNCHWADHTCSTVEHYRVSRCGYIQRVTKHVWDGGDNLVRSHAGQFDDDL